MPDSLINYTANGWPYLDANNYVEVIPQYTDELAALLNSRAPGMILSGPGRPDQPATTAGIITGSEPVGATYLSTNGANVGAWAWRKRPTGWRVTDGNTGWRSITPINGWAAAAAVLLRRVGNLVELHLEISAVNATSASAVQLPAGFGLVSGVREVRGVLSGPDPNTLMRRYYITGQNQVQVMSYQTTDTLYGQVIGFTDDPWPSTLPGTAA